MDMITVSVIGAAVAANLMVIKYKFEHNRTSDAILDTTLLVLIGFMFSATISGLMIGTIASAIISIYLLISPPKKINLNLKDFK